jgi:hypothetical protein
MTKTINIHQNSACKTFILFATILIGFTTNSLFAQLPALSWVNASGPKGSALYHPVHAVDSAENVYVSGSFADANIDFDTSASTYNVPYFGNDDIFLAKYDPQGVLLWAFSFGTNSPSNETAFAIDVDQNGDVYISGIVFAGADFDPGPGTVLQPSGIYGFIAKYNPQGNLIWCNSVNVYPRDIVIDHAGDLAVTGYFNNTADFDPGPGVTSFTSVFGEDIFLAKYSAAGALYWAFTIRSTYPSSCVGAMGWSLGCDSNNNLVVQGRFKSSCDFDPGAGTQTLTAVSNTTLSHFLAKYTTNGNYVWAFKLDLGIQSSAIAIDATDNIVMGMSFGGSADIDPGPPVFTFAASDPLDLAIIKYSPAGNLVSSLLIPGSGVEYFYGISANVNSDVYITGMIMNSVDFDPGPGQWDVAPNGYIAKYSSQGGLIWAFSIAGLGDHALETPSGSIHWVGTMSLCADFDPSAAVLNFCPGYTGGTGIFAAKYVQGTLSVVDENPIINSVNVFPNPAGQTMSVSCNLMINYIEITDVRGARIFSAEYNSTNCSINTGTFEPGLYFIAVATDAGISTVRAVIEH